MPERDWQKDWELCMKATPGPWKAEVFAQRVMPYICEHVIGVNASFIAEARESLPYWLQRVRELEKKNDELRADIAFLIQEYGETDEPMSKDAVELKERCHILKERDELRARVEELEKQLEIAAREITKAHEEYDMCPSDYDGKLTCVCNGTIADVWRCWRERWRQKALAMLEGEGVIP